MSYSRSDVQDVKLSAKHAALAFHDLQLTYLSGHMPADKHLAFDIALSCVNLAECAGDEMDSKQMARIYGAAAMQSRRDHSNLPVVSVGCLCSCVLCPTDGSCLVQHVLLSRMRKSCTALPADLQWLVTPDGQDFFFSADWSQMAPPSVLWTKQTEPGEFLLVVSVSFCMLVDHLACAHLHCHLAICLQRETYLVLLL